MSKLRKKKFAVWIYDEESGCNQPMTCKAKTVSEARKIGRKYIRSWNLKGAQITRIENLTLENAQIILQQEECYCSLNDFYIHIANLIVAVIEENTKFDHNKIRVSEMVMNEIWSYYRNEKNMTINDVSSLWIRSGPKVDIQGQECIVDVESGFVINDD